MDHNCHHGNLTGRGLMHEMKFHVRMLAVDGMFAGNMNMKLL